MLPEKHTLRPAQDFLLRLFRDAPKDHWIEFRAKKSEFCKSASAPPILVECARVGMFEKSFDMTIADWILAKNKQGYHIWYGVCPRAKIDKTKPGRPKTAKDSDVEVATAAWVDIDKSEAFWTELLEEEDIPASAFIASGKGLHLYFFYPEPKPVKDASKDATDLAERWGGDKVVANPSRVMRVPGTYNWKYHEAFKAGEVPKPQCELLLLDTEKTWEGIIPVDQSSFADLDWDLRTVILGGHDQTPETRFESKDDTKEIDRSAIDFRVMKELLVAGFSEEQVREIFFKDDYGISAKVLEEEAKHNGENYFQRTFRKAASSAEVESLRRDEVGTVLVFEKAKDIINAPPLRFAVERVLPAGGMAFLSGEAKCGKSLIVTDLMMLLAGVEGEFLEQFRVNIPGPVAYLQAEVSKGSLKFRMNTIAASREALWERLPLHFYNGRLDFGNPKHARVLKGALEQSKISYLIVDPLARFHRKNENRVDEMSDVLGNIEWAGREAGVMGTVVVHHHNKPSENKGGGMPRIRGSSVIGDWGNSHIMVTKKFSDSINKRKYISVNFELRDAEEPDPIEMNLDSELLRFVPFSEDNDKIAVAIGLVSEKPEASKDEIIEEIREQVGGTKVKAERLLKKARRIVNGKEQAPSTMEEPEQLPDDEDDIEICDDP